MQSCPHLPWHQGYRTQVTWKYWIWATKRKIGSLERRIFTQGSILLGDQTLISSNLDSGWWQTWRWCHIGFYPGCGQIFESYLLCGATYQSLNFNHYLEMLQQRKGCSLYLECFIWQLAEELPLELQCPNLLILGDCQLLPKKADRLLNS